MRITVTARHSKLTEILKESIRDKVAHLEHYSEHITRVEVILDVEPDKNYSLELIVHGLHDHIVVARMKNKNALTALEGAVHKAGRQLRKVKEKHGHKHDGPGARVSRAAGDVWW